MPMLSRQDNVAQSWYQTAGVLEEVTGGPQDYEDILGELAWAQNLQPTEFMGALHVIDAQPPLTAAREVLEIAAR